jgi:hypothetical protein
LAFLIATWPAVWRAWRGQGPLAESGEWVQRWVAFPAVTAATALHAVELAMAGSWVAALPMGVASVAFAVQAVVGHLPAGRDSIGVRVGRVGLYGDGLALIFYGAVRAGLEQQWWPAAAAVVGSMALGFLLWVLHRLGPPGGSTRPDPAPAGGPGSSDTSSTNGPVRNSNSSGEDSGNGADGGAPRAVSWGNEAGCCGHERPK